MLKIGTRDEFDAIRRMGDEEAKTLDEQGRIIRQFLRGDPIGPITQRREALGFADDLLGSA